MIVLEHHLETVAIVQCGVETIVIEMRVSE